MAHLIDGVRMHGRRVLHLEVAGRRVGRPVILNLVIVQRHEGGNASHECREVRLTEDRFRIQAIDDGHAREVKEAVSQSLPILEAAAPTTTPTTAPAVPEIIAVLLFGNRLTRGGCLSTPTYSRFKAS